MISIIIITTNIPDVSRTVLAIQEAKDKVNYEIFVVYKSKSQLKNHKKDSLKYVHYNGKNETTTIPEQRNVGIGKTRGKVIVFIDASCLPQKNWLSFLVRPILEDGEFIVAGKTISQKRSVFRNRSFYSDTTIYLEEAPTINIAINKEVFDRVGLFDESFSYGSDIDFTWRARDRGYKIRYEPKAIVTHDWGDTHAELLRAYRYGLARGQLYLKHPSRIYFIPQRDSVTLVYFFLIPYCILALWFPWLFLVFLVLFVKNRKFNPVLTIGYNLVFGLGIWSFLLQKGLLARPSIK